MPSILCVTYDTSTGQYLVQKAGSSQIADGAITSGKIGVNAIWTDHITDLAVTSAKLAAALIGSIEAGVADEAVTSAKLASGAVIGDRIAYAGIFSGRLASGAVGTVELLGNQIVTSAKITANIIATPHILNQGLLSSVFGANVIATPHILNQGILSASFGAAIIAAPHIANQGLRSANYGALDIGGAHIANQGLLSANLAVGVIGDTLVANYGIVSGKYASGSITEGALVSGISIDIAEVGQEPTFRAQELVSAYLGVYFAASGYFNYAQAATATKMPAVGIAAGNILSGQIGTIHHTGRIRNTAWDLSGYVGSLVFVGTSSEVTLMVSGLMVSGRCVQRMGQVIDEDAVFLRPDLVFAQVAE